MPTSSHDRVPALILVGLTHLFVGYAFLHTAIVERQPPRAAPAETQISLIRETPLRQPVVKARQSAAKSGGLALPYFNPYAYNFPSAPATVSDGISVALSACDPGRYDMASAEVRRLCDRIGMALKNDPGHFGIVSEVSDPVHWRQELARRETPHLLPCMKAHAAMMVDLKTLLCLYRNLFVEYDSKKNEHYAQ